MFKTNLKNKKGFSLVELMVVVAIMGTLAAIAIPAYNEYRKSAKKAAYKADLSSLHKGWLAFGVELDSFCQRETSPTIASIVNVGMESLTSSELYGENGDVVECITATCTDPNHDNNRSIQAGTSCSGTPPGAGCTWATPARTWESVGPGKDNFIGFGTDNCSNIDDGLTLVVKNVSSTVDAGCQLNVSNYKMGVYGQVSGKNWFASQIQENGVINERAEGIASVVLPTTCQ